MSRLFTDEELQEMIVPTSTRIRNLFQAGDKEEAKEIFDELLSHANHVGLFSEDLDFKTKRLLGNFPQAYSHLALINTARIFEEDDD